MPTLNENQRKNILPSKKEEVFFHDNHSGQTLDQKIMCQRWMKFRAKIFFWNSPEWKTKVFLMRTIKENFWIKRSLTNVEWKCKENIILKFLGPKKVTICDDKHLEKFWRFLQPRTKSICGWSLLLCHYYVLTPITRHFIKKMWKGKSKIMLKTKIHIKYLTISSY